MAQSKSYATIVEQILERHLYVDGEILREAEAKFGIPKEISLRYEIDDRELALIRGSRKGNRSHDVTFFIFVRSSERSQPDFWRSRLVVIRKPSFPPGAYRAPSGGLVPGESIEAGAKREAYEETGLDIELGRYLLRIHATFTHGAIVEKWVTHVFSARVVGGGLDPKDTGEIEDARYVTVEQLQGPIRDVLLGSGRGLFAYRVALTDAAIEILSRDGVKGLGD